MNTGTFKNPAAVALGSIKSEKKAASSRENGKKGGRPRTADVDEEKREYQREWIRKRREDWFAANGPCVDCGSRENLELDHDSRSGKISHRIWSWNEKRRLEELAKCVVRCHDCHRAKTNTERQTWSTKAKKPTLEQQQREMRARLRAQIILNREERRAAMKSR